MPERGIVHQFAHQICRHDAVSNEIFTLRGAMAALGIESEIVCDLADGPLPAPVRSWSNKIAKASRLTIVHYSHGFPTAERIFGSQEQKLLLYHNITPSHFFRSAHRNLTLASDAGRQKLSELAGAIAVAATHSDFSAQELRRLGFRRVEVLPYVPFTPLYNARPDEGVLASFGSGGWVNLICVAQVAPHKRIEDSIFVFDYFKRFVNRRSRLLIIGGWAGTEAYLARLQRLVKMMNLRDVVFTGQVPQKSLLAYYKVASAFLCMSEHEGFCVPLVEAMRYDIPIFAYASTAIPETLRGSGVQFSKKDWPAIAEGIGLLLADAEAREEILAHQRRSLEYYSPRACQEKFGALLESLGVKGDRR
jgi:glycosyltransferase involved in cell wall biosynthesis